MTANVSRVYQRGVKVDGWCCKDCHTRFSHHGAHRRTFARVVAHTLTKHRRLPVLLTTFHVWTWTARTEDGAS